MGAALRLIALNMALRRHLHPAGVRHFLYCGDIGVNYRHAAQRVTLVNHFSVQQHPQCCVDCAAVAPFAPCTQLIYGMQAFVSSSNLFWSLDDCRGDLLVELGAFGMP